MNVQASLVRTMVPVLISLMVLVVSILPGFLEANVK